MNFGREKKFNHRLPGCSGRRVSAWASRIRARRHLPESGTRADEDRPESGPLARSICPKAGLPHSGEARRQASCKYRAFGQICLRAGPPHSGEAVFLVTEESPARSFPDAPGSIPGDPWFDSVRARARTRRIPAAGNFSTARRRKPERPPPKTCRAGRAPSVRRRARAAPRSGVHWHPPAADAPGSTPTPSSESLIRVPLSESLIRVPLVDPDAFRRRLAVQTVSFSGPGSPGPGRPAVREAPGHNRLRGGGGGAEAEARKRRRGGGGGGGGAQAPIPTPPRGAGRRRTPPRGPRQPCPPPPPAKGRGG